VIATYAPPATLRRWLPITKAAVQDDPKARDSLQLLRQLMRRLRSQWLPATELPAQLVHGDLRLGNVCRAPTGETIYFDLASWPGGRASTILRTRWLIWFWL